MEGKGGEEEEEKERETSVLSISGKEKSCLVYLISVAEFKQADVGLNVKHLYLSRHQSHSKVDSIWRIAHADDGSTCSHVYNYMY